MAFSALQLDSPQTRKRVFEIASVESVLEILQSRGKEYRVMTDGRAILTFKDEDGNEHQSIVKEIMWHFFETEINDDDAEPLVRSTENRPTITATVFKFEDDILDAEIVE